MMRNPVFDVMKGIGIILMLVGHIPPGETWFHIIYSFHMPLFFIVAGVFANFDVSLKDALLKDVKRLLLPVLVTMAFVVLLSPLAYADDDNFNNVIVQLFSVLWLGDAFDTKWGMVSIDSLWFLMALFWARCFFRWIGRCCSRSQKFQDELILVVCIGISVMSIKLHSILPKVPFGVLHGLSALNFYAAGWYLKRHHLPSWAYLCLVGVWLVALRFGGIYMAGYQYGCYPIDMLGAIGATWLVYELSRFLCLHMPKVSKLFRWFGVNSLAILCINTLDRKTNLVRAMKYVLGIKTTGFPSVMFHYAIELVILLVVVQIAWMRSVYGTKRWNEL